MKPFSTPRTRELLARKDLTELDRKVVNGIEEFGSFILTVTNAAEEPGGYSYTVGAFDASGVPELITVGLRASTGHYLLDAAVELGRKGVDLSKGHHRGLIGDVECEFRPVDRKWVRHLMNFANWYNEGRGDVPVLQAVYPDLENRFPEDPDFDIRFEQPLLQPDAPETMVSRDLWTKQDPNSSINNWKFADGPHSLAFVSNTVRAREEDVVYAAHDSDGWQFLGESMAGGGGPAIVCLHHVIDDDPTIAELADLPVGWCAERDAAGEPWSWSEKPEEDESE